MTLPQPSHRFLFACALVLLVAAALVRAQTRDFQAKRAELRRQAAEAQRAEGLFGPANQKALFAKYPTPEIKLAKPLALAAGASGSLSVPGKFPANTAIVAGSDAITLADVVVTAGGVKATVTASAGLPPQWARVYAFAPVSNAETWTPVFIGAPQSFMLKASNGWTVKLTPDAPQFTVSEREARVGYKAEYFKAGAATPFETTTGSLTLEADNNAAGSYMLPLRAGQAGSVLEEYGQLSKRMVELMQAGKINTKEFAALQKKMEVLQERLNKEMAAQVADPTAAQKKQDDFGCETIFLTVRGGRASGNITCGRNVGSLEVSAATP